MTVLYDYLTIVLDPMLPRHSMQDVVDRITAIGGVLLVDVAGLSSPHHPIDPNKDANNDKH